MSNDENGPSTTTYPTTQWGALAADPWAELASDFPVWFRAVKHAWLRDGGTKADFAIIFSAEAAALAREAMPPEAAPAICPDAHETR